jgi:colanic acid biosynthesis glycosyl transferase WcaI
MEKQDLRVLLIGLNFPPEVSGIAPYTGDLARHLAEDGSKVQVLTTFPHYPQWKFSKVDAAVEASLRQDGVEVTRIEHFLPNEPSGVQRFLSEISFGLRASMRRWRDADLLLLVSPALFSSFVTFIKASLFYRKLPVIVWVQDLYSMGYRETRGSEDIFYKLLWKVERWLLSKADSVVVIHERFKRTVMKEFSLDGNKVHVLRNWTHSKSMPNVSRAESRAILDWKESETLVLHTGNMGVKQGLENVVLAARIANERGLPIKFVLLGDGSTRESLLAMCQGLQSIEFLDPVDSQTYHNMLEAADILLVNELNGVSEMSVPSKLTSYFQAGKPVVASTDPDGITAEEVNLSQAGLVVTSNSPDGLVNTIVKLSKDHGLMSQLGINGRKYADDVLSKKSALETFRRIVKEVTN